ncbi:hypothetical protein M011DRAFT_493763 [Sporormia fimetaria CBS 119925]|uniref:Altered inheritance of mitochondria protein 9, mitochondrial n=1 Tax=Sporormia fimetaria CBS 119925 TaxID=1340428 RepID=A0A6A6VF10_9PLEO|nr:hypothetical protein M011DRAFT_493763 [Sporormia fimetaria CBS 119925]
MLPLKSFTISIRSTCDLGSRAQAINNQSRQHLWNEQEQQRVRYRRFNVPNLQRAACQAIGAHNCISREKIGEGNYNKAYRLTMGDGRKVIAKIPHPNAGPAGRTTSSEVAIMEYARSVLNLPVPRVLKWSATAQNPVEAEYIIMEEARGERLFDIWHGLRWEDKYAIVMDMVKVETKLLSVCFNNGIDSCEPIVATGPQEVVDQLQARFCIGPTAQREFYEKERQAMHQYQGPWNTAADYLEATAKREIDWISSSANPKEPQANPFHLVDFGQRTPSAHISTLRKFISAILLILPKDPNVVSPRFWHPDFPAGNIYVSTSTNRISSIIDWQSATISPLLLTANPPKILDFSLGQLTMALPDDYEQMEDKEEKKKIKNEVAQSNLVAGYQEATAADNPLMYEMLDTTHSKTLKQLAAFAGCTWDDSLFSFKSLLMRVQRDWDQFQTDQPCPYKYTDEEMEESYKDADTLNKLQDLWEKISTVLTKEGYTHNETYDDAVEVFEALKEALETAERSVEEEAAQKTTST